MCDAGLEHLGGEPLDSVRDRPFPHGGDGDARADLADGLVVDRLQCRGGEAGVADGHLGAAMPEEGHQGLHRHAGVGQLGGPGVAKLVSDDA